MSRPYQTNFSEDRSPLNSAGLRSPLSPDGTTPSFKTNVNRAKSKRWVEAKTVDYGGDDWGDDEDYDDDYEEPQSSQSHQQYQQQQQQYTPTSSIVSPTTRPTGLRQAGQGLASRYGELGRNNQNNTPTDRSVTINNSNLGRRSSFEAGDERRAFSTATSRAPVPAAINTASTLATTSIPTPQSSASTQRTPSPLKEKDSPLPPIPPAERDLPPPPPQSLSQPQQSQPPPPVELPTTTSRPATPPPPPPPSKPLPPVDSAPKLQSQPPVQESDMYSQRRPVPVQTQPQMQPPHPQPHPSPRQNPLPSLTIQTQPPPRMQQPPQLQQAPPQQYQQQPPSHFQQQYPPRGRAPYEEPPYGRSQSPRGLSQPRAQSQNRSQDTSAPPPSGGRFPPRKSSLSTTANPAEAVIANMPPPGNGNGNGGPSSAPHSQSNFPTPAQRRERASSNVSNVSNSSNSNPNANRSRTGTNPEKALPFIRPADIYKRIAEERERKRRESLESSNRDSMDDEGRSSAAATAAAAVAGAGVGAAAVEAARPRSRLSSESLRGRTSTDDEGRRPGKLDTVAERKSEYGFDNFLKGQGVADADIPPTPPLATDSSESKEIGAPPQRTQTQQSIAEPQTASSVYSRSTFAPTSAAEERPVRSPTALPEINRFSTFGDDFMGSSFGGDGANDTTPKTESLRHNPSTGMRSVVNTAFDNNASPTSDSSFQRSDSNATSNISPIVGGTMLPSLDAAVDAPATIAEEPPTDARVSQDSATIPGFVPGHRRDLSTPSPGNSPARHARVQSSDTVIPKSELAEVTAASPTVPSPTRNQESRPTSFHEAMAAFKASGVQTVSRPTSRGTGVASPLSSRANSPTKGRVRDLAGQFETKSRSPSPEKDRESLKDGAGSGSPTLNARPMSGGRMESFRPVLPGGWVSYVTNAPSSPGKESPGRESPVRESPVRASPSQTASPRGVADEEDTPTEDVSSKAFAAVAAAGAALAGALTVVGAGEQSPSDKEEPSKKSPTHGDTPVIPPPTTLNPSPTRSNRSSFAPPSPPPKDTPRERSDPTTDYFPAPIALRPRKSDTITADTEPRDPSPQQRPRWVSSLSSDTNPADLESDRLRKEIMRSLSPGLGKTGDDVEHEDKDDHAPKEELLTPSELSQSARRGRHESKLIPSEYDTYWQEERPEGKEDDRDSLADSEDSENWDKYSDDERDNSHTAAAAAGIAAAGAAAAVGLHQVHDRHDPNRSELSIISEGSRETEKSPTSAGPAPPPKPPAAVRRFSWEEAAQDEPIESAEKQEEAVLPGAGVSVPGTVPITLPEEVAPTEKEAALPPPMTQADPVPEHETVHSPPVAQDEGRGLLSPSNAIPSDKPHPMIPTIELSDVEGSPMPSPHAPGSPVMDPEINRNSSEGPQVLRLSGDGSLSGSGNEGRDVEALSTQPSSEVKVPSPKSSVHFPAHISILSFKEILAMQSPRERVSAFDTARSQHATTDQDALSNWLKRTMQSTPEHNTLLNTNYNADANDENQVYQHRNMSVRKFPKISSLSSAVGGGMGHTRSPSGSGGLSSVRNEAKEKGRDLIHSAGVFGGKAGGAAKGFLAKGRSRFGKGGSEKVD